MVRRNIRNAIFLPLQIRTLRRTCRFRLYGFGIRCRYSEIIPLFFLGIHLNTLNSSLHFGFSVPDTDFLYQRSGHNRIRMISGDNIGWISNSSGMSTNSLRRIKAHLLTK